MSVCLLGLLTYIRVVGLFCFSSTKDIASLLIGAQLRTLVMANSTKAVYGIYADDVQVTDVVYALNVAGFENQDICLVLARTHPISTIVREAAFSSADREASALAALLIEWLSELGAVVIRRFGFFIRSERYLRTVVTTREAPALCGNFETLMDLGFCKNEAERLQNELCEDGVVVYVACSQHAQAKCAREMLKAIGARETAELDVFQGFENDFLAMNNSQGTPNL
jgi:hypothetical protein